MSGGGPVLCCANRNLILFPLIPCAPIFIATSFNLAVSSSFLLSFPIHPRILLTLAFFRTWQPCFNADYAVELDDDSDEYIEIIVTGEVSPFASSYCTLSVFSSFYYYLRSAVLERR